MTPLPNMESLSDQDLDAWIEKLQHLKALRAEQREAKALQTIRDIAKEAGLSPEKVVAQFQANKNAKSKKRSRRKAKVTTSPSPTASTPSPLPPSPRRGTGRDREAADMVR